MRLDIIKNKSKILEMISENKPKSDMCRILNCRPMTLNKYLLYLNIEYSGNKGSKGIDRNRRKHSSYYLGKDRYINSHTLRMKLIEDGIKEHKCEKCGLSKWLDELIPLELHHIDGNRFNNILENIQILCPNCHSKTENNSGKSNRKIKIEKICKCGNIIHKNSSNCKSCVERKRKVNRPTYDQLTKEIEETNYCAVGRKYGVSDNSVRKWIKRYEKIARCTEMEIVDAS